MLYRGQDAEIPDQVSMEVRRSPRKKSPSPAPVYNIPSDSNSSDSSEEESQEKADKDFKPSHSFKPSQPEVRRSPRKKSPSPAPVYKIPSGSSSDSSEEEAQEKSDKDFKPSHSFKPSHLEVRRSPRKKSPSPAPVYKIPSGSNSSDSSEEETQDKSDKDFKPSHSFKPSHEVRRSPRKKSPSPAPVYKIPSGSSSNSSEEETQEKADKDFKPSHPEPSSSCSSASGTPKKKRRRKESLVEETARSESEDGSRSETELNLQSNLSGVPRKRKHAKSKRPSNCKARWRQGLPDVIVRDYDHSMVKGFLGQVSALQQRQFNVESWDADDDISSDDDDDDDGGDDADDNSPLREEEEDFPGTRVVPSETFIERLQREI